MLEETAKKVHDVCLYNKDGGNKIFKSDKVQAAMKDGWADSPAAALNGDPATDNEPKMTPEDRAKKLEGAIIKIMSEDDLKKKTAAGMPTVGAIQKMVGFDISADERTEIFDRLNAERKAAKAEGPAE